MAASISDLNKSLQGQLDAIKEELANLQTSEKAWIADATAKQNKAELALFKQKLEHEKEIANLREENLKKIAEIEEAQQDRNTIARLKAENEVLEKRKENEETINGLIEKRQLMMNSSYLTELRYQKQLNDQLQKQQKIAEAMVAAGVTDPNSKAGKRVASYTNFKDAQANQKQKTEEITSLLGKGTTAQDKLHGLSALVGVSTFRNINNTKGALADYQSGKAKLEALNSKGTLTEEEAAEKKSLEDQVAAALEKTGLPAEVADNTSVNKERGKAVANAMANAISMISSIAKSIDGMVDEIASQKSTIDTRLNGLSEEYTKSDILGNSYWKKISQDFSALMVSPLVSEKDLMSNAIATVEKGIARDVEQTAMLATLKDNIASTFNVYDSTMLRLIKVQDSNTTAVRMGMEVTLNKMLNSMYESTEYLSDIATNVRSSLGEAEALMSDQQAVEFEYNVQKWLGSMYSVGMSSSGVNSIATALGQIASGQIEGITGGGAGNLVLMAANKSNISIADMLADGLDASETNVLMSNMVDYMSELVDEANGSNVVQQQLAKVFGLTASDLKSIKNIVGTDTYKNASRASIFNYGNASGGGTNTIYNGLLGNLYDMANSMYSRVSTGQMLQNVWSNLQYSVASGIASNSVLYLMTKTADLMDSLAGGMEFSLPTVMGNGMSAQTWKVSDILRTASLGGGAISSLAAMIGSMASGNGAGFTGTSLLNMVGINSAVKRGASTSSSGSGTITNSSVSDIQSSAESSTTDEANSKTVSAEETSTEVTNTTINNSIQSILELLTEVVDGTKSLSVDLIDNDIDSLKSAWN